jgi:chromosome segregation ATPase
VPFGPDDEDEFILSYICTPDNDDEEEEYKSVPVETVETVFISSFMEEEEEDRAASLPASSLQGPYHLLQQAVELLYHHQQQLQLALLSVMVAVATALSYYLHTRAAAFKRQFEEERNRSAGLERQVKDAEARAVDLAQELAQSKAQQVHLCDAMAALEEQAERAAEYYENKMQWLWGKLEEEQKAYDSLEQNYNTVSCTMDRTKHDLTALLPLAIDRPRDSKTEAQ